MEKRKEFRLIKPKFGDYGNTDWSKHCITEEYALSDIDKNENETVGIKDLGIQKDITINASELCKKYSFIDTQENIDYNIEKSSDTKVLEGGNVYMDENKILEKYLDKMDQDKRDQEERLSKNMQLMEQRITEERRLSEERMEKRFNDAMEAVKSTNLNIEKLQDKLEEKTNSTIEKIDSTNKWIIGTCIATILGIAGIAASAIWGGLIK